MRSTFEYLTIGVYYKCWAWLFDFNATSLQSLQAPISPGQCTDWTTSSKRIQIAPCKSMTPISVSSRQLTVFEDPCLRVSRWRFSFDQNQLTCISFFFWLRKRATKYVRHFIICWGKKRNPEPARSKFCPQHDLLTAPLIRPVYSVLRPPRNCNTNSLSPSKQAYYVP